VLDQVREPELIVFLEQRPGLHREAQRDALGRPRILTNEVCEPVGSFDVRTALSNGIVSVGLNVCATRTADAVTNASIAATTERESRLFILSTIVAL
jgi:hypothetical protein